MGFKKYSPRPWNCKHYTKGMWTIYSKIDKEDEIAICRTYTDNKNAEMDAHLIAAAPELLEAAISAFKLLRGSGFTDNTQAIIELKDAIWKAGGI